MTIPANIFLLWVMIMITGASIGLGVLLWMMFDDHMRNRRD